MKIVYKRLGNLCYMDIKEIKKLKKYLAKEGINWDEEIIKEKLK